MTTTMIEQLYSELRQVFDPEIPVNIIDLGLVYDVQVEGETCNVTMTLTSESGKPATACAACFGVTTLSVSAEITVVSSDDPATAAHSASH